MTKVKNEGYKNKNKETGKKKGKWKRIGMRTINRLILKETKQ